MSNNTHSKFIGYLLWIVGFSGAHRFYFGRKLTGILWFFTGGLLLIGWLVDFFLIPSLDRSADAKYRAGKCSYDLAWIFLSFAGIFGLHRMYLGKWGTGILYLLTLGLLGIGLVYDFLTLNEQISEVNSRG